MRLVKLAPYAVCRFLPVAALAALTTTSAKPARASTVTTTSVGPAGYAETYAQGYGSNLPDDFQFWTASSPASNQYTVSAHVDYDGGTADAGGNVTISDPGHSSFNGYRAAGTLTASTTPSTGFSGADLYANPVGGIGARFTLDGTYRYHLTANVNAQLTGYTAGPGVAENSIELYNTNDPFTDIFYKYGGDPTFSADHTGTLGPGQYVFSAYTDDFVGSQYSYQTPELSTDFDFALELTPVPAPASGASAGAALALVLGVGLVRRRPTRG